MGGSFEFYGPTGDELMLGNILIHALDDNLNIIHNRTATLWTAMVGDIPLMMPSGACLGYILEEVPEGSKRLPLPYWLRPGGGIREVIKTMIEQVLDENYEVYIYYLEE